MADDYGDEDDFNGFSDSEEPEIYDYRDEYEHRQGLSDDEASEAEYNSDDEPKEHTGFFDDEASETSSDVRSEAEFNFDDAPYLSSFSVFLKLPPELREMIWKAYCPDLSSNSRLYELRFTTHDTVIQFAAQVEGQTEGLRNILAIHRESRNLGHKFAPDLIQLSRGRGVAPCHMERDIIFVSTPDLDDVLTSEQMDAIARVAPAAQRLAFRRGALVAHETSLAELQSLFPLKHLYINDELEDYTTKALSWCASPDNQEYHIIHKEDPGIGYYEELDLLFTWPHPEKYGVAGERSFNSRQFGAARFDKHGVPVNFEPTSEEHFWREQNAASWGFELQHFRHKLNPWMGLFSVTYEGEEEEDEDEDEDEEDEDASSDASEEHKDEELQPDQSDALRERVSVWPIARFMFESGMERLAEMKAWDKPWDEWHSEGEGSEDEEDEEELDSDDSLNDFIATGDTIELESDEDEDRSSAGELSPQDPSQPVMVDLASSSDREDEPPTARSRDTRRGVAFDSDSDEEEGQAPTAPERAGNSSRRARIVDSDSSEEEEPTPDCVSHRARPRVVPDDSDDEDDDDDEKAPQPARRARTPIIIASDDDEDDEGDEEDAPKPARRARPILVSDSDSEDEAATDLRGSEPQVQDSEASSSSEQDSSDDNDETPPPPKKPSLARMLQQEAAAARAARAASEESDGEAVEERDSGDEEEDGMILGMAEEGDEEDEEDGEEERW